jgi:hypothetical protein
VLYQFYFSVYQVLHQRTTLVGSARTCYSSHSEPE